MYTQVPDPRFGDLAPAYNTDTTTPSGKRLYATSIAAPPLEIERRSQFWNSLEVARGKVRLMTVFGRFREYLVLRPPKGVRTRFSRIPLAVPRCDAGFAIRWERELMVR